MSGGKNKRSLDNETDSDEVLAPNKKSKVDNCNMVEKEKKFSSSTAQLALRIKDYLENNKSKKFIDIEDLCRTLYDQYPEYGRKKFKAFKVSCERTFHNLQQELSNIQAQKKKEAKAEKKSSLDDSKCSTDSENTNSASKSVNSRITDLYAKSPKPKAIEDSSDDVVMLVDAPNDDSMNSTKPNEKVDKSMDIAETVEDEIDKVIEAGEQFADDGIILETTAEEMEEEISSEPHMSDFEKIQQKTKKVKENMNNNNSSSGKKAKKSRPSQSLKAHLENGAASSDTSAVITKRLSVELENINSKVDGGESNGEEKSAGKVKTPRSSVESNPEKGKSSKKSDKVETPRPSIESIVDCSVDTEATPVVEEGVDENIDNTGSGDDRGTENIKVSKTTEEIVHIEDESAPFQIVKEVLPEKQNSTSHSKEKSSTLASKADQDQRKPPLDSCDTPVPRSKIKKRTLQDKEGAGTSVAKKRKNEVEVQESSVRFSDFGGSEELLCDICKLLAHLKHPQLYKELGVSPPRGFLLHGPPGCGKTLLAHAIVGELGLPFIKVAAPELVSGVSGDSESKIRDLFQQASDTAPCVLFIDEIDCITQKRENAQREMERRIVAQLLTCLDELGKGDTQVVVIGATNRPDSLDPALRRAGRFDREIGLGIPDRQARGKILNVLCRNLRLDPEVSLHYIATLTPGYVGADLSSLVREAAIAAVNRVFQTLHGTATQNLEQLLVWLKESPPVATDELKDLCIQQCDWQAALKVVQPSAKREGFATVPGVSWQDVGALANIREELQLSILAPVRFQEEFESLGLPASSGVLLAGPPGCGKTLVAKAIANEAGINFISVKGPELLNMYVGESERAVRACFARARNSAPCVIFFDEIDSLCPKRSGNSGDGGSSSRVVNQLLTEMDGVQVRNGVFLMAATNRPDILDPAVLRPGRLDKILYVGFPAPQDRCEILKALTKNGTKPTLGEDVNLEEVGRDNRCDGFTGADMSALVREASMAALKDRLKINEKNQPKISVDRAHFESAFSKVRPSVDPKDRLKYDAMERRYTKKPPPSSNDANHIKVSKPREATTIRVIDSNSNQIRTKSFKELSDSSRTVQCLESDTVPNENTKSLDEDCDMVNTSEHLAHESSNDKVAKDTDVPSDSPMEQESTDECLNDVDIEPNNSTANEDIEMEDESNDNLENIPRDDFDHDKSETEVAKDNDKHEASCHNKSSNSDTEILNDTPAKVDARGEKEKSASSDKTTDNDTDNNDSDEVALIELTSEDESGKHADSIVVRKNSNNVENNILNFLNSKDDGDGEESGETEKTRDASEEENAKETAPRRRPSVQLGKATIDPDKLRFLPNMIIRVVDSSKVPSAAGRTGVVKNIRKNNKVTVSLEGLSQRIVHSSELEPFMPEEGDKVKLLIPGSTEAEGKVLSMNDEDVCEVKIDGFIEEFVIDNLCKIN